MADNDDSKQASKWPTNLKIRRGGGTRVYIVEYIVMHIALLGVISAGIRLFNELLDQTARSTSQFDIYDLAGLDYTLLVVSYGLVSTVIFLCLNSRVSVSEKRQPRLVESRRRRLVPYIFLTITSLLLFAYIISAVYSVMLELFGEAPAGGEDLWRVLLKQAFAVILIGLVSLMVARGVDSREPK